MNAISLLVALAAGLINPALQPQDLLDRHRHALVARVVAVDASAGAATARVERVLAGGPFDVDLRLVIGAAGAPAIGDPVVVFVGKRREDEPATGLCYSAQGWWMLERIEGREWRAALLEAEAGLDGGLPLSGTWIGEPAQLVRLLEDAVAGTLRFPRRADMGFAADRPVVQLPSAPACLVVADLTDDGIADLLIGSPDGDEILVQVRDGGDAVWRRATRLTGLQSASRSIAVADADGDGVPDLLANGLLHYGGAALAGRYAEPVALVDGAVVFSCAWIEIDGDGWPEALVATSDGVRLWRNPGPARGAWTALGDAELPALPPGPVAVGDWDGDGRADLYGGGLIAVADGAGGFRIERLATSVDPGVGRWSEPATAGVFAPFLDGQPGLCVPTAIGWHLFTNEPPAMDRTAWGGELSEGPIEQRQLVTADLDLDGRPDLYAVAGGGDGGRLLLNRGYGMFMRAEKNPGLGPVFPGPAHGLPAAAVAVGDLDEDGVPDLVVGADDGGLATLRNETLERRAQDTAAPGGGLARLQQEWGGLAVAPAGRGAVGATVRVLAPDGAPVAAWMLGSGGGMPPAVWSGLPAGTYRVVVRWSDGVETTEPAEVVALRVVRLAPRRSPHGGGAAGHDAGR